MGASKASEDAEGVPTPDVAVVVPAYGGAPRLQMLLEALSAQAVEAQETLSVIVSDDGSPVELHHQLSGLAAPNLSITFVMGPNAGPGAARNRGVRATSATWVAFLDADTLPGPGWLAQLLVLVRNADAPEAFEGSVLVPDDGASPFSHATRISQDVAHGGANIVYRRDAFLDIGGFSEDYFDRKRHLHFREDNDLYFRACDAGLEIRITNDLIAYHPPLEPSFLTPALLARRYYFDPLLGARHPNRFRELNRTRMVGPVSLRSARHWAAVVSVVADVAVVATAGRRRKGALAVSAVAGLVSWAANVAAVTWGKKVGAKDSVAVGLVSLVYPWVYSSNFYRGVLRFRHLPRL